MLPVTCIAFVLLIAMVPIASFAGEAHKSDWGYSGATGPNHWGDLKPNTKQRTYYSGQLRRRQQNRHREQDLQSSTIPFSQTK